GARARRARGLVTQVPPLSSSPSPGERKRRLGRLPLRAGRGATQACSAPVLLVALLALLSACGPQPSVGPSGPGAPEGTEAARRPKVLTIGIQREPPSFNPY